MTPKTTAKMDMDPATRHRVYEGLVTHLYRRELAAGSTFLDVGANVGHHTWQMADAVGATGAGFAVEAVPALAGRVRNVLRGKEIDWVEVIEAAVSDEPGQAEFYFRPSHIGWSSLYEAHIHPDDDDDDRELLQVQVSLLDTLLADRLTQLDVIKLDIEHSEFRAMRGAREIISKHRPMMVFENSPKVAAKVSGYSYGEFFDFFDSLDYRVFDIYMNPFVETDLEKPMSALEVYYVALPGDHRSLIDPAAHFGIAEAVETLRAA